MSTPRLTGMTSKQDWEGTVISRSIRAWMAGYEMNHADFAEAIGMIPRTFERRLKSGKFLAKEVQACAAFMSRTSGDQVTIADLFAGKISVFGPLNDDKPTLACDPPLLRVIQGTGDITPPIGLLSVAS